MNDPNLNHHEISSKPDTERQPKKTCLAKSANKGKGPQTSKKTANKDTKQVHYDDKPAQSMETDITEKHASKMKASSEKKVRKVKKSGDSKNKRVSSSITSEEKVIYMSIEYNEETLNISADGLHTVAHLLGELSEYGEANDRLPPTIAGWEGYADNKTISSICTDKGELTTFYKPMLLFAYDPAIPPMYAIEIHDYYVIVDEIDGDAHYICHADPKPRYKPSYNNHYSKRNQGDYDDVSRNPGHSKRPIYQRTFENSSFANLRSSNNSNLSKNYNGQNRNPPNRNQPVWQPWN